MDTNIFAPILPHQKITFDLTVTDPIKLQENQAYSLILVYSYNHLRQELEVALEKIHKPLIDEVFSQAWSPCMYQIKLELLSYRSFESDGLSRMLFERIRDQRSYEGIYHHFSRQVAKLNAPIKIKTKVLIGSK